MKALIVAFTLGICIGSCGKANSDGTHAEVVPSPQSGFICFAIYGNDGKVAGGNCAKE